LCYADDKVLDPFWINTSTNALIQELLAAADEGFTEGYHAMIASGEATVTVNLEASYLELSNSATLWGLLLNAGYITAAGGRTRTDSKRLAVKIPNDEVRSEFRDIFAAQTRLNPSKYEAMRDALMDGDIGEFTKAYQSLVLTSTSYYDAKENAYHMLFLGMCLSLDRYYKISSNIEAGLGRCDILMESKNPDRPHIIIEFKEGEDTAALKNAALRQVIDRQYYAGLAGKVLCLGIAHNKKQCEIAREWVDVQGAGAALR
jgi:hypothetical protein